MRCAPLLLALALFSGCDRLGGDGTICTLEARAAVSVQAYDAVTRAALAGYRATVRDGTFSETVEIPDGPFPARANLATERTGRYVVTVEKDGYASWSQSQVDVEEDADGCHVVTAALDAYLSPIATGPGAQPGTSW